MEHVVYLLGAGFSAPLGIPVMSDFLSKSKDMHSLEPTKYPHFQEVFKTIKDMSVAKNYYNADLFNIEEILSVLEMQQYLNGIGNSDIFKQYIVDVITHYTPMVEAVDTSKFSSGWKAQLFGNERPWYYYGYFIASILSLRFELRNIMYPQSSASVEGWFYSKSNRPNVSYSIVTLNYDMLFEKVRDQITSAKTYHTENQIDLSYNYQSDSIEDGKCSIAKLHGSVEPPSVILPTWKKGGDTGVLPAWKLAHKLLERANHIRILGYSLPTSDSYVRYLLKSAVLSAEHIKSIDIICLDPDGEVKRRYDEFMAFGRYRFKNADISTYLKDNFYIYQDILNDVKPPIEFNRLDISHERFMQSDEKIGLLNKRFR